MGERLTVGYSIDQRRESYPAILPDRLERYFYLAPLFSGLTPDHQLTLASNLDDFFGYPNSQPTTILDKAVGLLERPKYDLYSARRNAVKTLFTYPEPNYCVRMITEDVDRILINKDRVFDHPVIPLLIDELLREPNAQAYQFQLGALLSVTPMDKLGDSAKQQLAFSTTTAAFKTSLGHKNWWLCTAAEQYLQISLSNKTACLVKDGLLVQFRAKIAALCLTSFVSSAGFVFLANHWYCPTDTLTRDALLDSFYNGEGRITLGKGSWAYMRPMDYITSVSSSAELIAACRAYQPPDHLPDRIKGLPRQEYYERHQETN